jgi:epsilon-lactone hydrolase
MYKKIILSRRNFDKLGENYPKASGVIIKKQIVENIECFWFKTAKSANCSKIAIYLHGGCFVFGSVRSHHAFVSHLAKYLDIPVLFIEYSLAPEKPYPNAVNDIFNVFRQIKIQNPLSNIVLIGDSAGGWLSMALLSKLNKLRLQPPKYNIMISPWIDLSCSNNSITENSNIDPILNKTRLLELVSLYISNHDLSKINFFENTGKDFPSTLILVGSREILLDDSRLIYNKIIKVQPNTTLSIYENQTHVWLLDNIDSEHSKNALKEIKKILTN